MFNWSPCIPTLYYREQLYPGGDGDHNEGHPGLGQCPHILDPGPGRPAGPEVPEGGRCRAERRLQPRGSGGLRLCSQLLEVHAKDDILTKLFQSNYIISVNIVLQFFRVGTWGYGHFFKNLIFITLKNWGGGDTF